MRTGTDIRFYLNESRQPVYSGEWVKEMPDAAKLNHDLIDRDWASNINLFLGMLSLSGGRSDSSPVPNPSRWIIAARSYIDLALDNSELFRTAPASLLNDLRSDGQSIVNGLGSRDDYGVARALMLYTNLVTSYQSELRHVEQLAKDVRYRTLHDEVADDVRALKSTILVMIQKNGHHRNSGPPSRHAP